MSGMTMTPQRNLRVAFVGPYLVSGKSILTKDATIARIDEASDLDASQLTVVALEGSTSQRFVERQLSEAKLITVADYDSGVAKILDDSADLMVADYPICMLSLLRHADEGLVTLAEPMTIEPIGVLAELETKWFDDPAWLILLP